MGIDFKEVELHEVGNFIHLKITGKLTTADYDFFVPEIDNCIERHGKVNMLIELIDFEGWTLGALWEDTKFGVRHFNDFTRIALVGDKRWEETMAKFVNVFTSAQIKYFDVHERDEAIVWVNADNPE